MTATNININNNNILPDTLSNGEEFDLSETCHEDKLHESSSCFSTFTLCLDEDDQCSVSVFDDDDASFLGEEDDDDDDISTGSCDEEEEVVHEDSLRSTRTEIDTDNMDTNKIIQEGRELRPLLAGRPVRERRRGGRRPARKPSTVAE